MSKYESAVRRYVTSPEDQARCETIVDLVEARRRQIALSSHPRCWLLDRGLFAAFALVEAMVTSEAIDPSPACGAVAAQRCLWRARADGLLRADVDEPATPLRAGATQRGSRTSAGSHAHPEGRPAGAGPRRPALRGGSGRRRLLRRRHREPFQEFSVSASTTSPLPRSTAWWARLGSPSSRWSADGTSVEERLTHPPVVHAVFRKVPVRRTRREGHRERGRPARLCRGERADRGAGQGAHSRVGRARAPGPCLGSRDTYPPLLDPGRWMGWEVAASVDSDFQTAGQGDARCAGHRPGGCETAPRDILVSSGTVHHEIARQIREDLCVGNEIVLLYE